MIVFDNLRPISEEGRAALRMFAPGAEITDAPVFVAYRRPPAEHADLPVRAEITTDRMERARQARAMIAEGYDDDAIAERCFLTLAQIQSTRAMMASQRRLNLEARRE